MITSTATPQKRQPSIDTVRDMKNIAQHNEHQIPNITDHICRCRESQSTFRLCGRCKVLLDDLVNTERLQARRTLISGNEGKINNHTQQGLLPQTSPAENGMLAVLMAIAIGVTLCLGIVNSMPFSFKPDAAMHQVDVSLFTTLIGHKIQTPQAKTVFTSSAPHHRPSIDDHMVNPLLLQRTALGDAKKQSP